MNSGSASEQSRRASARAVAMGFVDRPAQREYFTMALAALLFSISHNYSALLAIVFEQSGHSLQATGWLLSVFAFTAIAGALLSSAFCARIGVLATVRWSIFLTFLSMASFALTREIMALATVSRLVQGVGVGALVPAALVYIQSRVTREKFVVLVTGFSAVIPLAAAIAPPLGEWTLERYGQTALFVEAAIPAAAGLLLTIGMRDAARPKNSGGLNLTGGFEARLYLPYIVILAGGGLYGYSVNYLAASMQERNILLAAFFIPSSLSLIAVRFGGIWFLGKLNPRVLVAASLLSYGIGYIFIAAASGAAMMVTGGLLFGIGNSIMYPVVSAWVGEGVEPDRRAAPQAVSTATFYFGIYALPWPQTFLIAHWGYEATEYLWAVTGLVLTLVLVQVLLRRRTR